MSMTQNVRNDGKIRREPRLGLPVSKHNGSNVDPDETAPSWHELVQPGSKGNPARTLQRRADRDQITTNTATVLVDSSAAIPRDYRRNVHGRGWNPGRLVLHARRAFPRASALVRRTRRGA